jgi:hypothetical protein
MYFHLNDLSNFSPAMNQHTAIEQLLQVVFCVVRAAIVTTQQYGEHASAVTVKLQ